MNINRKAKEHRKREKQHLKQLKRKQRRSDGGDKSTEKSEVYLPKMERMDFPTEEFQKGGATE
jgi:hypothetical protein